MRKRIGSLIAAAALLMSGFLPEAVTPGLMEALAAYVNTNQNTFIHDVEDIQMGYVGQEMQFRVRVGYNGINGLYGPGTEKITDVIVRMSNDPNYINRVTGTTKGEDISDAKNPYDPDDVDEVELYNAWKEGRRNGIARAFGGSMTYPIDSGTYPFEISSGQMAQEHRFDELYKDQYEEVTFRVQVRADVEEGYYGIPISIYYNVPPNTYPDYQGMMKVEYVNVYVSKSGEVQMPGTLTGDMAFAIGEGQMTPVGTAPNVMEFGVNFRNQSGRTLYDVIVHINPSVPDGMAAQLTHRAKPEAVTGFPFNINESNYDRVFQSVQPEETVTAPYSMAIMPNTASAFYPLSFTVSYKLTPEASASYKEDYISFVRIDNPSMDDNSSSLGEFNVNDRTKARLIVAGFHTEPEQVFAGQRFDLVLNMKNASDSIGASNILFSLESDKADNVTVFSTESGANSFVVNSLRAGETAELRVTMDAAPGVDPRSYAVTINEKYDSPDFKNAEEKVTINIPVYQVARMSVSNFELTPETIEVGRECNVMFGINNTGKVMLYNVEAIFEADSIRKTSSYVGNLKPGETGNIDVMITGVAPTQDDGTIPIRIRYEDVNGNEAFTDQECTLFVTEPVTEDMDMGEFVPEDTDTGGSPLQKALPVAVPSGLVVLIAASAFIRNRRKKKRRKELEDD